MKTLHKKILILITILLVALIAIVLYFPFIFSGYHFRHGLNVDSYQNSGNNLISCLLNSKEIIAQEGGDYYCGFSCNLRNSRPELCKSGFAIECPNGNCDYYFPAETKYGSFTEQRYED